MLKLWMLMLLSKMIQFHALAAADALGNTPKNSGTSFMDITDGIDIFSKGLGDTYYPSNDMDPYLKDNHDDDSEELEDMTIKAEDSVIVCAHNEDYLNRLEVWILQESEDGFSNMFVHHDIIIPEFPLCTTWLDCPLKGEEKGVPHCASRFKFEIGACSTCGPFPY